MRQDQASYLGGVLADAAGEHDRVEAAEGDGEGSDRLGRPVAEDVDGEPGRRRAVRRRLAQGAHVVAQPGQAEQPAARVERADDAVDVEVEALGDVAEQPRVDVAAAGAHHQALERGQAHGGVDGLAAADGRRAAPVAQVQHDQVELLRWPAQHLGGPGAHEAVAGAVEAVAPHLVLVVPLLRDGVAVGDRRHRLVEGGVEDRDLHEAGQRVARGLDAEQVGRHVQRRQVDERVELGQGRVVDGDGGAEAAAAVHHPVADADQPVPLLVGEGLHEVGDGTPGRRVVGRAAGLLRAAPQAHHRVRAAHALREPGHPPLPRGGVDERQLDRRAAAVEDEHRSVAHGWASSVVSTQSRTSGMSCRCSTTYSSWATSRSSHHALRSLAPGGVRRALLSASITRW